MKVKNKDEKIERVKIKKLRNSARDFIKKLLTVNCPHDTLKGTNG